MIIRGKIHLFKDDIDTDKIIPGPYLRTTDPYELASYCMYGIDRDFPGKVREGDIIVAGENFGCGSSREQAPLSIKYCGIKAVVAESFARIFYRNAVNIGLIPVVCRGIRRYVKEGDILEIHLERRVIRVGDRELPCEVPQGIAWEILKAGGLVNYAKKMRGELNGR
ncbi:MAG TPA: 3-isopropylmalate dehydratase small subunit [Methanothermococcus okinawensis]|uniref:Methanogen homoaconitase small subunit n=1 Tax=Methanothermococcus okinawensis TaxID=155863 RepID=A0A832ZAA3_9EURY|nr:3-isopropylmalate dehydratase small subunit [Methanothermococcus okinawensis]HIP91198.1 3-isopropylmalate dehydratase small subunit [Methanothermococcus okinawensis]